MLRAGGVIFRKFSKNGVISKNTLSPAVLKAPENSTRQLHSNISLLAFRRNMKLTTDIRPKVQGQPVLPPNRDGTVLLSKISNSSGLSKKSYESINDEVRNAVKIDEQLINKIGIDRVSKALNYSNMREAEDILIKLDESDCVDKIFDGKCIETIRRLNNLKKFQDIFGNEQNFLKIISTIDGRHIFAESVGDIALDFAKHKKNGKNQKPEKPNNFLSKIDSDGQKSSNSDPIRHNNRSQSNTPDQIVSNFFDKITNSDEFVNIVTQQPSCYFVHDLIKKSSGMVNDSHFKPEFSAFLARTIDNLDFLLKNKNSCFILEELTKFDGARKEIEIEIEKLYVWNLGNIKAQNLRNAPNPENTNNPENTKNLKKPENPEKAQNLETKSLLALIDKPHSSVVLSSVLKKSDGHATLMNNLSENCIELLKHKNGSYQIRQLMSNPKHREIVLNKVLSLSDVELVDSINSHGVYALKDIILKAEDTGKLVENVINVLPSVVWHEHGSFILKGIVESEFYEKLLVPVGVWLENIPAQFKTSQTLSEKSADFLSSLMRRLNGDLIEFGEGRVSFNEKKLLMRTNQATELTDQILRNLTDLQPLSSHHVERPTRTLFHRIFELPTACQENVLEKISKIAQVNRHSKIVRTFVYNSLETGQLSNIDQILRECPNLAIPVLEKMDSEQMARLLASSELKLRGGQARFGLDNGLLSETASDIERFNETEKLVGFGREKIQRKTMLDAELFGGEVEEKLGLDKKGLILHKVKEPVDSRNKVNVAVMQNLTKIEKLLNPENEKSHEKPSRLKKLEVLKRLLAPNNSSIIRENLLSGFTINSLLKIENHDSFLVNTLVSGKNPAATAECVEKFRKVFDSHRFLIDFKSRECLFHKKFLEKHGHEFAKCCLSMKNDDLANFIAKQPNVFRLVGDTFQESDSVREIQKRMMTSEFKQVLGGLFKYKNEIIGRVLYKNLIQPSKGDDLAAMFRQLQEFRIANSGVKSENPITKNLVESFDAIETANITETEVILLEALVSSMPTNSKKHVYDCVWNSIWGFLGMDKNLGQNFMLAKMINGKNLSDKHDLGYQNLNRTTSELLPDLISNKNSTDIEIRRDFSEKVTKLITSNENLLKIMLQSQSSTTNFIAIALAETWPEVFLAEPEIRDFFEKNMSYFMRHEIGNFTAQHLVGYVPLDSWITSENILAFAKHPYACRGLVKLLEIEKHHKNEDKLGNCEKSENSGNFISENLNSEGHKKSEKSEDVKNLQNSLNSEKINPTPTLINKRLPDTLKQTLHLNFQELYINNVGSVLCCKLIENGDFAPFEEQVLNHSPNKLKDFVSGKFSNKVYKLLSEKNPEIKNLLKKVDWDPSTFEKQAVLQYLTQLDSMSELQLNDVVMQMCNEPVIEKKNYQLILYALKNDNFPELKVKISRAILNNFFDICVTQSGNQCVGSLVDNFPELRSEVAGFLAGPEITADSKYAIHVALKLMQHDLECGSAHFSPIANKMSSVFEKCIDENSVEKLMNEKTGKLRYEWYHIGTNLWNYDLKNGPSFLQKMATHPALKILVSGDQNSSTGCFCRKFYANSKNNRLEMT